MLDELYILPILLFSVVIHELAHGWMALRLGDPTARDLGRLTLNPIPHIDPIGSVLIPLMSLMTVGRVLIAWAKPVPVDPRNFAFPRRDDILVSIVGPASNLILALCCTGAFIGVSVLSQYVDPENQLILYLQKMFHGGIILNIILGVFNMIPVPPLDGSHVLASVLPAKAQQAYRQVGFFGIFVLLMLMNWKPFETGFYFVISSLYYPFEYLINQFI